MKWVICINPYELDIRENKFVHKTLWFDACERPHALPLLYDDAHLKLCSKKIIFIMVQCKSKKEQMLPVRCSKGSSNDYPLYQGYHFPFNSVSKNTQVKTHHQ